MATESVLVMAGAASLTGTNGTAGFDTAAATRTLDSKLVMASSCKYVDFVVYSADLLNQGFSQKWAVGMAMGLHVTGACLVRLDVPGTMMVMENIGATIAQTGYGAAWLYGNSIYVSTNEATTPELQNVIEFANITVTSYNGSALVRGTVSFVAVSKSAETNFNDGLNCPVSASPFNTACPCGNCTKCYIAPSSDKVTATQLAFTVNANGCAAVSLSAGQQHGSRRSTSPAVTISAFPCQNATLQQPLQLLKPAGSTDFYMKVNELSTDDQP